jgi:UDP-N-acetylmuramoylalanine--D-glutamate ligase
MKFNFFKNKKITIMGIGLAGRIYGIVKFFKKRKAIISATDLRTKEQLFPVIKKLPKDINLILGKHRILDFTKNADFILKNPAVKSNSPFLNYARNYGVPIITDVGLFFLGLPPKVKVIGVTGTKGKTTTSLMIYNILKKSLNVKIVGIPKTSFLEILDSLEGDEVVVAELSSFDLEGISWVKKSPDIAVITNIDVDHLDRYNTIKEYIKAKSYIFEWQSPEGIIVANGNSRLVKKLIYQKGKSKNTIWFLESKDDPIVSNANAAIEVAKIFGIKPPPIEDIIKPFLSYNGHFEKIFENKNLVIINDTCATNPLATKMALRRALNLYPHNNIIIILGGMDKNLKFKKLLPEIKAVKFAILLPGSASLKILKVIKNTKIEIFKSADLKSAIMLAKNILKRYENEAVQNIILFSPSAASFNIFKNEFERGEKFKKLCQKILIKP